MPNTLTAITSIVSQFNHFIPKGANVENRIQQIGVALEAYVKDLFSDSFLINSEQKEARYLEVFSYTGNPNRPPDVMLRGGDAIEIKKMTTLTADIHLNSSYPKHKLSIDSPFISTECRNCEEWTEKDLIYAIGYTPNDELRLLWLIYGDCYAANISTYSDLKHALSEGISGLPNIEFNETNELARITNVDPLGITNLRVRGMWTIQHPNVIFDNLVTYDRETQFQIICLMRTTKYYNFAEADRIALEATNNNNLEISDVSISDPNDPQANIDCKLITFKIY